MDNNYFTCMDPIPLQDEKFNKLYKFYKHLREGRLTTTVCGRCEKSLWPPRTICPVCKKSDELKWIDLSKTGKLVMYSMQVNGVPPGYNTPLLLGVIEFENGVRIISALENVNEDGVMEGDHVELVVKHIDADRVMPSFKIVK